jgi:hypothetical protein
LESVFRNAGIAVGAKLNRRTFITLAVGAALASTLPAQEPRRIAVIKRGGKLITRNCCSQEAAIGWLRSNWQASDTIEIHPERGPLVFQRHS